MENEYEAQRARRIAENAKKMKELNIPLAVKHLSDAMGGGPSRKPIRGKSKQVAPKTATEPPRRSTRPVPERNYKEEAIYATEDGADRKARKVGSKRSKGERIEVVQQSAAAQAAAQKAAREKAAMLGSTFKRLTYSQVHHGFWLNVPVAFARSWPKRHIDHDIRLLSSEQPSKTAEWEVKWLTTTRKNDGAGLSGGWRGFATDNGLTLNDSIAFETVKKTGALPTVKIHIFRAKNYEPEQPATA
ncbi:hypothetical protein WJX73_010162 [Symbiochloris irregularis]|uniref:TF-B3 domain-containing protein n=1 Tax=Symbiochloris irregularis TaxID=706552 RepID=A0AAW1NUY4_9CHLO